MATLLPNSVCVLSNHWADETWVLWSLQVNQEYCGAALHEYILDTELFIGVTDQEYSRGLPCVTGTSESSILLCKLS